MKRLAITLSGCLLATSLLSGCDTLRGMVDIITPSGQSTAKTQELKALADFKPAVNLATRWQVNTGHSSKHYSRIFPYLNETAVFVAGGESVSAWNKANGGGLWKTPVSEKITGGVNGGGGQVFVGTADGSAIALNAANGQVQWAERLSSEILAVSNADQGVVVFRTADGKLNALSATSGEMIWQRKKPVPALTIRGGGVPVALGGIVVAGFDDGTVTAFELKTGRGLWETILSVPRGSNDIEQITDVDGRLKILGSALFATSYSGRIAGIDMQNGKPAWVKNFASHVGVEANQQSLFAVSREGEIWRLNPQTGEAYWKSENLQTRSPTTPTLAGDYLVVGDIEGYLHWLNAENGQTAGRLRSDPKGYNTPVVADGNMVYSFGKSGILAAHTIQ
ncbi:MAG: outer membrane protein assembly factor BamB [Thiolinea sp.]